MRVLHLPASLLLLISCFGGKRAHGLSSGVGSVRHDPNRDVQRGGSRRDILKQSVGMFLLTTPASTAFAAVDCFSDCFKNCKAIAPNDLTYCNDNCKEYCAATDRTDGLSGSKSAESGEVGILGGAYGLGTVVKGEDKPPSLAVPGLDFTSAAGRKLLGY